MALELVDRVVSWLDGVFGDPDNPWTKLPVLEPGLYNEAHVQRGYKLLRSLYYNNRAYRARGKELEALNVLATTLGLRSLQHALVEFYVATIWPGNLPDALPILWPDVEQDSDEQRAQVVRTDRIHQIWQWSNWERNKQLFTREQAMLGDAWLYIASRTPEGMQDADRVYFHRVVPEHVTDVDEDGRGFPIYLRLDIPEYDRERNEHLIITQVWWKQKDLFQEWVQTRAAYAAGTDLPTPTDTRSITGSMGIDFLPFTHAKHRDIGEVRGMAPIVPALEKQDELNAKSNRHSQRLFRHGKADMAFVGKGGQSAGVYQPPPPITELNAAQQVEVGGDGVWTVPPGYELQQLVAGIDFQAHERAVLSDLDHLRESDVPELAYYLIARASDLSGKAIRMMLTAAVARAEEARGNAEAALVRANQMALTIAQVAGLEGFSEEEIGLYEEGDFDHTFEPRDIIPADASEDAQTLLTRAQAAQALVAAGADAQQAFEAVGFNAKEAAELAAADLRVVEQTVPASPSFGGPAEPVTEDLGAGTNQDENPLSTEG